MWSNHVCFKTLQHIPRNFFFDYREKTFPHSKNVKDNFFLVGPGKKSHILGEYPGTLLFKIGNSNF